MKTQKPGWTGEQKLTTLIEYSALQDEERGRYLRERGLHEVQIQRWRKEAQQALGGRKTGRQSGEVRRMKELERELKRKDRALAEAAALLVLKKKGSSGNSGELREGMVGERRRAGEHSRG